MCDLIREDKEKPKSKQKFQSILVRTPRSIFAQSIYGDLKTKANDKFVLYKDVDKDMRRKENFIVCQLESLASVRASFDLVVMDESESILAQFDSSTIKGFDVVAHRFHDIMKSCKYTVWADAFVLDRSLVMCNHFRGDEKKVYI